MKISERKVLQNKYTYEELMKQGILFIRRLNEYFSYKNDGTYIDIAACELLKYHFPNYIRSPIKFILRFIIDLIFVKNYSIQLKKKR